VDARVKRNKHDVADAKAIFEAVIERACGTALRPAAVSGIPATATDPKLDRLLTIVAEKEMMANRRSVSG
jgi:hypothetical protein